MSSVLLLSVLLAAACTALPRGQVDTADYADSIASLGFDPGDAGFVVDAFEEKGADRYIDVVFEGTGDQLESILERAGLDLPATQPDREELGLFYDSFLLADEHVHIDEGLLGAQQLLNSSGRRVSLRYLRGPVGGAVEQLHVTGTVD